MTGKTLLDRWSDAGRLRAGIRYEDVVGMAGTVVLLKFDWLAVFSIPVEDGAVHLAAMIQLEHGGVQAITSGTVRFIDYEEMRTTLLARISDLGSEGCPTKAVELEQRLAAADSCSLPGLYNELHFTKRWNRHQE